MTGPDAGAVHKYHVEREVLGSPGSALAFSPDAQHASLRCRSEIGGAGEHVVRLGVQRPPADLESRVGSGDRQVQHLAGMHPDDGLVALIVRDDVIERLQRTGAAGVPPGPPSRRGSANASCTVPERGSSRVRNTSYGQPTRSPHEESPSSASSARLVGKSADSVQP